MKGSEIFEVFERVKSFGRVIPLEQRPLPPRVFYEGEEWRGEFFCMAADFSVPMVYEPGGRVVISLQTCLVRETEYFPGNVIMGSGSDMLRPSFGLRQEAYLESCAEAVTFDNRQVAERLLGLWQEACPEDFRKWYNEKYPEGR